MISHSKKFLFIHVPRAGGTSMVVALRKFKPQRVKFHMSALEFREMYPDKFQQYFKFSFVRNPWDRMLSEYFYTISKFGKPQKEFNRDEFLKTIKKYDLHHRTQWSLLSDGKKLLMDFVGRFENLTYDWKFICEKLGVDIELPHRNTTQHKHYSHYYDEETKSAVALRFEDDIVKFGYTFDEE